MKMKKPKCSYCGKEMKPADKELKNNPFSPFCSERCKLADLDKWFNGEYAIEQPIEELTQEQLNNLPEESTD
jgi:endogenous inhibitor of DNA gyrase (YacG/DUF329 family)